MRPNILLNMLIIRPSDLVAVTTNDYKFDYLVDRTVILEQVAKQLAFSIEERTD
jgi:hypothetical protein